MRRVGIEPRIQCLRVIGMHDLPLNRFQDIERLTNLLLGIWAEGAS
jgi:hypothetical protein